LLLSETNCNEITGQTKQLYRLHVPIRRHA
jgi:hypothetical protein